MMQRIQILFSHIIYTTISLLLLLYLGHSPLIAQQSHPAVYEKGSEKTSLKKIASNPLENIQVGSSSNEMSPPLSHDKKVYVDEVKNKLFWPMGLPFWVRLSASPDDNAPSYLLDRISPLSDEKSLKNMDKGIQLDLSGNQFIRWFNKVTNATVLLQFYADGKAPTSKESLYGAPIYTSEKQMFAGKGLKCTIISSDQYSGVEKAYVSIDGKPFTPFKEVLNFNSEKEYNLRFYAVDNVGNAAELDAVVFTVDLTPPSTKYERKNNFIKNTLSSSTTITLSSSDQISGVKNISYLFDDLPNPPIYSPTEISITHLTDGPHTLIYGAVDQVENRENPNKYSFYLDKIPPVPQITILGDMYPAEGGDYISARSLIQLSATDNSIGVDNIEFKINKNKFSRYSIPFVAPLKTGLFSVNCRAVDKLKNMSSVVQIKYRLDITPPKCTFKIDGPNFSQASVIWMTKNTRIIYSATDDASGVQKIEYQLGNKPVRTYAKDIRIADEGQYFARSWGIDNVNNRLENEGLLLIVDNTPPEIIETLSLTPVGVTEGENGKSINVYPRYLSVFLAAIDKSSGIKNIYYSINDSKEKEYKAPLLFKEEGTFHIQIRAFDNVENVESKTISVIVEG